MKVTSIVRRVDDLGRIVIPKEIRRTLKIREGDPSRTHLHPWSNSNKRLPISTYGARIKDYVNKWRGEFHLAILQYWVLWCIIKFTAREIINLRKMW